MQSTDFWNCMPALCISATIACLLHKKNQLKSFLRSSERNCSSHNSHFTSRLLCFIIHFPHKSGWMKYVCPENIKVHYQNAQHVEWQHWITSHCYEMTLFSPPHSQTSQNPNKSICLIESFFVLFCLRFSITTLDFLKCCSNIFIFNLFNFLPIFHSF